VAITPDEKDWTWVLEKPCPECGFDASTFPHEDVAAGIRENAASWPLLLESPDCNLRTSEDRWSTLEYACHVRDVFCLFDKRLTLMLEEDDPVFPNWDQDETAIEDRYNEQDPSVVASDLQAAASALASRFDSVPPDAWSRKGRRGNGSAFTVDSLSRYLLHDPVHHIWDVTA
jgi:hypothetical protein